VRRHLDADEHDDAKHQQRHQQHEECGGILMLMNMMMLNINNDINNMMLMNIMISRMSRTRERLPKALRSLDGLRGKVEGEAKVLRVPCSVP
jgi:predicted sugar kinase